jgi:hypothetical protein
MDIIGTRLIKKIEEDFKKDTIAKKNGYVMFRVREKDSKRIDILLKIKEISDEIQACKNKQN